MFTSVLFEVEICPVGVEPDGTSVELTPVGPLIAEDITVVEFCEAMLSFLPLGKEVN